MNPRTRPDPADSNRTSVRKATAVLALAGLLAAPLVPTVQATHWIPDLGVDPGECLGGHQMSSQIGDRCIPGVPNPLPPLCQIRPDQECDSDDDNDGDDGDCDPNEEKRIASHEHKWGHHQVKFRFYRIFECDSDYRYVRANLWWKGEGTTTSSTAPPKHLKTRVTFRFWTDEPDTGNTWVGDYDPSYLDCLSSSDSYELSVSVKDVGVSYRKTWYENAHVNVRSDIEDWGGSETDGQSAIVDMDWTRDENDDGDNDCNSRYTGTYDLNSVGRLAKGTDGWAQIYYEHWSCMDPCLQIYKDDWYETARVTWD